MGRLTRGPTTPSLGPKGNNLILAGKEGWTEMAEEAGLMAGTKSPGGCPPCPCMFPPKF